MKEYVIKVYEIATDGMPPDDTPSEEIGCIVGGSIMSAYPANDGDDGEWAGSNGRYHYGVTHWFELPCQPDEMTATGSDSASATSREELEAEVERLRQRADSLMSDGSRAG